MRYVTSKGHVVYYDRLQANTTAAEYEIVFFFFFLFFFNSKMKNLKNRSLQVQRVAHSLYPELW